MPVLYHIIIFNRFEYIVHLIILKQSTVGEKSLKVDCMQNEAFIYKYLFIRIQPRIIKLLRKGFHQYN